MGNVSCCVHCYLLKLDFELALCLENRKLEVFKLIIQYIIIFHLYKGNFKSYCAHCKNVHMRNCHIVWHEQFCSIISCVFVK